MVAILHAKMMVIADVQDFVRECENKLGILQRGHGFRIDVKVLAVRSHSVDSGIGLHFQHKAELSKERVIKNKVGPCGGDAVTPNMRRMDWVFIAGHFGDPFVFSGW